MPMLRILTLMALLAPSLLLSNGAWATVVSGSFTGIIDGNVQDTYGLFGTEGADLSGQTLTATYSYDTDTAFSYEVQPTYDAYLGIDNLSLSVTIGGSTVSTGAVTGSQVIDTADGSSTSVVLANLAPAPVLEFSLSAEGAWIAGVTIDAAFVLDPLDYNQTIYVSADGSSYDVLTFDAAPVPAPGSLPLLGVALAALGALRLIRARRPEVPG